MHRIQNWPHALADYLRACQDKPFAWGAHDCAHFAAGAVQAVTGDYPAFPRYKTERAALKLINDKSLRERAGEVLGPEITVQEAQRGDVILVIDATTGPSLGVCFGEQSWFLGKPAGTRAVPTVDCWCAWRVG
jgi:hypothetical protein